MSADRPTDDAPDLEPWARSGTVLGAFRERLPPGLAVLCDEALIDSLMRSAFYALYGVRPPASVPLTALAASATQAGRLH
jgi:hypothetical protein